MDPLFPSNPSAAIIPVSNYLFAPGIFYSDIDQNKYLSSLDSDTRDYVIKHTDEFRTRQDIDDCINRLHSKN